MAEGIAFGLAEKVLTELGSRAIQELGSAMGVKKELKKLGRTLSTIKAVLLHAEELEVRQPEVREWLRRIKDAVYEADDIIDDFAIEALRKRLVMQDSVVNHRQSHSDTMKKGLNVRSLIVVILFTLLQDVTVGSSSLQRSQTSHLDLNQVNHVGGPSDSWPQDGSSSTSLEVVKRFVWEADELLVLVVQFQIVMDLSLSLMLDPLEKCHQ